MIWIIVPYRDVTQPERRTQLDNFLRCLPKMVPDAMIFIMEQSNDGRKFNRGALLNAGFSQIFTRSQASDTVIFHDVDLLPDARLARSYTKPLRQNQVRHLAAVWKRYTGDAYLGGALAMRCEDFVQINGYPNKYWGWGGEDDELGARIRHHRISIHKCSKGTMTDMENLSLQEKLSTLKEKCTNKWEARDAYRNIRQWRQRVEGLSQCRYTVLRTDKLMERVIKVTIKIDL